MRQSDWPYLWSQTHVFGLDDGSEWEYPRNTPAQSTLTEVLPAKFKRVLTERELPYSKKAQRSGWRTFQAPWPGVTVQQLLWLAYRLVWAQDPSPEGWNRGGPLIERVVRMTAEEFEAEWVLQGLSR